MVDERDDKGRFVPGNKAREGKSRKSYAQILKEVLDEDSSRKIILKAVEQAQEGDHQARTWLFSHVLPKLHSVEYRDATSEPASDWEQSGNPFRAFLDEPLSPLFKAMIDSMSCVERDAFERLFDQLADRHDTQPLPRLTQAQQVRADNEYRDLLDACKTEEELDVAIRIAERKEAMQRARQHQSSSSVD